MIEKIVDHLSKQTLTGWQVRETRTTSYQSFLAKEDRECTRTVDTTSYKVSLFQQREEKEGQTLGIANFRIGAKDLGELDKKVSEALFSANLVSNQPFSLQSQPKELPNVSISEPNLNQKTLKTFEDQVIGSVKKEKQVRLSAAEFFIDQMESRLINHLGLDVSQAETQLHMELILLAKSGEKENEFINRYTRRFSADFDLPGEVANSAKQAREATVSKLPTTGQYPVLISEEPLDNLFNPLIAKVSARLKYNKMIKAEKGQSVLENELPEGDKISLWTNGTVKGMVGSNRFDSFGTPANKTCLIEGNKISNFLSDKRYAEYLNIPVTGELGNIEVAPGSKSFKELSTPQDKPIYHLTAFSAFEPNSITGAFSAEIRSGYEISSKGVQPIKGGSVSGVLQKDLAGCWMSKELTQRERVFVPKGILFKNLAIAGT